MVSIQQSFLAQMSSSIYGVAGYYSETDCTQHLGGMQHVVVATTDGTLLEMHWNQYTHVTSPQPLKRSPGSAPVTFPGNIHSLSGFYTCDDNYQHVIVATEDGRLHEVYFTDSQHVNVRSPLYKLPTTAYHSHIGQAGFYSPAVNPMRVVTVGGADSFLHEVVWSASIDAFEWNPAPQLHLQGVAAIAGFYDQDDQSKNVIVALKEGYVLDVHSSGAGGSTTCLVTTFSPDLVNVAAFVDTDTHCRHVIALHESGQLSDYSYTSGQVVGQQTSLVSIPDVADIVAYYSHYDTTCHVIVATRDDRKIHEVYYR
jgi:hypothetical protein